MHITISKEQIAGSKYVLACSIEAEIRLLTYLARPPLPSSALSENIRPVFAKPVKYPTLPTADQLESHYVHELSSPSSYTRSPDDYRKKLERFRSPVNDFDAPHISNVGRRRANAVSLINTPPRTGHARSMAKLFEKAKETIEFQDQAALRKSTKEKPLLSTRTPHRRLPAEQHSQGDSRISAPRSAPHMPTRKPLPRLPAEKPSIPNWQPIGRLSDELPPELRPQSSCPRPLRVKKERSGNTFMEDPTHMERAPYRWERPSPLPRDPYVERTRPFPSSLGLASPPALEREHAMSEEEELELYAAWFEPIKKDTPRPPTPPPHCPASNRVASWLTEVDESVAPEDDQKTFSPVNARAILQEEVEGLDAGMRTPSSTSRGSSDLVDAATGTIKKLLCVPPLRLNFAPSRTGVPSLETPPKRFRIPAREGPFDPFVSTPPQSRHASNSSKSRRATPAQPATTPESGKILSEMDNMMLLPLSPGVERYRKGQGPRLVRCDSYFDKDILEPRKE